MSFRLFSLVHMHHRIDLGFWRERHLEETLFYHTVFHIDPELKEIEKGCLFSIEPHRSLLAFAEFFARRFIDQEWPSEGKNGLFFDAPDVIDAGDDIAPLIRAAHLHVATVNLVQMQVVVGLEQRVGKFGERKRRFFFEAVAHGVLLYHCVDGEMLADIAEKLKEL